MLIGIVVGRQSWKKQRDNGGACAACKLDIAGQVITADAMSMQKDIIEKSEKRAILS